MNEMADGKLTYENLDEETNDLLLTYFKSPFRIGHIKCNGCLLPECFNEFGDRIKQMEIRDDDIWMCCFPKTGSTWAQEMIWCITHDVDLPTARKHLLNKRFPFLESSALLDYRTLLTENPTLKVPCYVLNTIKYIEELPSPRFIKTHLPFDLLPDKLKNNSTRAKLLFVFRNARDTCVSFYHHCKLFKRFNGSFEQFAEFFLQGNVLYGPYPNHVKEYWNRRNDPNVLFLTYEEMKKDLKSVIYKTANFLGKSLNEDEVEKLLDHLSFSSMKQNRAVNMEPIIEFFRSHNLSERDGKFIRKGEVGDWKQIMDSDLCERFDEWERENLHGIGFAMSKNSE